MQIRWYYAIFFCPHFIVLVQLKKTTQLLWLYYLNLYFKLFIFKFFSFHHKILLFTRCDFFTLLLHNYKSHLLSQFIFFIKKCFLQNIILYIWTDLFTPLLIFLRTHQHTINLLTRESAHWLHLFTLCSFVHSTKWYIHCL